MVDVDKIRNVGIIAHVDHGKTTLTDVILSEGGVIYEKLVGERFLDYLEIERQRGITVKPAVATFKLGDVIVNLIDTPGHVDFSPKVTRSLRLMDGAILVVDAVEGVRSQTRQRLRAALEERVKPVLFINKIDRLIKELEYTPDQIRVRIEEIILDVNDLIEEFAVDKIQRAWRVKLQDGSVVFGSALYRRGLSVPFMMRTGIKFRHIYENLDRAHELAPLGKIMTDLIRDQIPSPRVAQRYRMMRLRSGEANKSLLACEPSGPTVARIAKPVLERREREYIVRVFSGTLREGQRFGDIRVDKLYVLQGRRRKHVRELPAGMVGLIVLSKNIEPPITLSEIPGEFRPLKHVDVAVIYATIEPKDIRKIEDLKNALELIKHEEDFSRREDEKTGEIIVYVRGTVHLGAIEEQLKKRSIEVYISEPMVIYKEGPTKIGESKNRLVKIVPTDYDSIDVDAEGDLVDTLLYRRDHGPIRGLPVTRAKIYAAPDASEHDILEAVMDSNRSVFEPYYEFEITVLSDYLGKVLETLQKMEAEIHEVTDAESSRYIKIRGVMPVRSFIEFSSELRSVTEGNVDRILRFKEYRPSPRLSKTMKRIREL